MEVTKHYCDRCKKEIKSIIDWGWVNRRCTVTYETAEAYTNTANTERINAKAQEDVDSYPVRVTYDTNYSSRRHSHELCADCFKDLKKFLGGEN